MFWIVISLLVSFIIVQGAVQHEPLTHQAARLLQPALQNGEHYSGEYGKTSGSAHDMYIHGANGVVKIYRPRLFGILREGAGVDERMFQRSIDADQLISLSADSKSGQAFWQSSDGLVVLKTIKHYECINLRRIIDPYAAHVLQDHSCIAGVLGLYRVRLRHSRRPVYLLACKNVYHSRSDNNRIAPRTRYDLKGSTVGRAKSASSSVLKDLDLIRSDRCFKLGTDSKLALMHALERDSQFLSRFRFMDYSLLVDVEETPPHHHPGIWSWIVHGLYPFRLPRSVEDR